MHMRIQMDRFSPLWKQKKKKSHTQTYKLTNLVVVLYLVRSPIEKLVQDTAATHGDPSAANQIIPGVSETSSTLSPFFFFISSFELNLFIIFFFDFWLILAFSPFLAFASGAVPTAICAHTKQ